MKNNFRRWCFGPFVVLLISLFGGWASGQWTSIGPDLIGSYDNGRATVIAVNPNNWEDVWLGTATGGLWHTSNMQAPDYQWEVLTDAAPSLSIGSILLENCDATRCDTIFVGTGENNIRRDTYYGAGLLKLSWNSTNSKYDLEIVGDTDVRFAGGSIVDIVRLNGTLYIAVSVGKSASASSAVVRSPEPQDGFGIHRSDDNGLTWQEVAPMPDNPLPSDLKANIDTLLAAFHGKGIFALSATTGEWCPFGPGVPVPAGCPAPSTVLPDAATETFDHVEIAVSPTNPNVMYVAYGKCESETWLCDRQPLFFRTADGGSVWEQAIADSAGIDSIGNIWEEIPTYSRYTHILMVHPREPDWLIYGGLRIWSSFDRGDYFNHDRLNPGYHLDQQDLVYANPNVDGRIQYLASDGGVYLTTDARQTWRTRNNGLVSGQFYTVCSARLTDLENLVVMGGTQDNGTAYFTGSPNWERVLGGDGGDCAINGSQSRFFASSHELAPHQAEGEPSSQDFQLIDAGIDPNDSVLVTPPYLQHPISKELFFSTERLYRREEQDSEWKAISPDFDRSMTIVAEIERKNSITAVGLARSDAQRIYVGMYNGSIWRTTICGPCTLRGCWKQVGGTNIEGGDGLPIDAVTSIDVDPNDADKLYVTHSSFSSDPKVWRSLNGGDSWEPYNNGLPPIPVNVIKIDPVSTDKTWLGTDKGIYTRTTSTAWQEEGPDSGLPNVPVYDISFDVASDSTKTVFAATHGRGVFMLTEQPAIFSYSSWRYGILSDLFLYGYGFHDELGDKCTVRITDLKGGVLAEKNHDALGGTVLVDQTGRLISRNDRNNITRNVITVCRGGNCIGRSTANLNRIGRVVVQCGNRRATSPLHFQRQAPDENPPSTTLYVHKMQPDSVGSFTIIPTLFGRGTGQTDPPPIQVNFSAKDTDKSIADAARDRATKLFREQAPHFSLHIAVPKQSQEDRAEFNPYIWLRSKRTVALQIVTGFRADPGHATGMAFTVNSIGRMRGNQLMEMKIAFSARRIGADGGYIKISERSPMGICSVTLKTNRGQSAMQIAGAFFNALMHAESPGTLDCPTRENPLDFKLEGSSISTVFAIGLTVEIGDKGIGVSVGPMETK